MPTVPSTCVSVDSFVSLPGVSALTEDGIFGAEERTAGPTPDPDTDDVVLVPVDQGNAVSQDSLDRVPPQTAVKPRIDLGSLNLHSPSSIVGTPFDISPRFEYPFPPASASPSFPSIYDFNPTAMSFPGLTSPLTSFPSGAPTLPMPGPPMSTSLPSRARGENRESRSFSPTHPKLLPRDPPVPPSLVKKRKLNRASVIEPVAPQPVSGRPRAGSLSELAEHLDRLAQQQERGRAEDSLQERLAIERDRSHSLDVRRKRAPLTRYPSDVTVVDQNGTKLDAKPPLSHTSSSRTLLPDSELDDDKKVEEPPRSPSPPSETSSRSSSDEHPHPAPL